MKEPIREAVREFMKGLTAEITEFVGDAMSKHIGSDFYDFLQEEGIQEKVTAAAIKRVIAWQLEQAMKRKKISKTVMAQRMHTSRAVVNRLLDKDDTSVTLATLARASTAVGVPLRVEFEGPKMKSSIGEIDPFRIQHRQARKEVMGQVVAMGLHGKQSMDHIADYCKKNDIKETERFIAMCMADLDVLHVGAIVGMRITDEQFNKWLEDKPAN